MTDTSPVKPAPQDTGLRISQPAGPRVLRTRIGVWTFEQAPVAAGVSPAVEPGVPPGGPGSERTACLEFSNPPSGRRDAALYGRRDACRYECGLASVAV